MKMAETFVQMQFWCILTKYHFYLYSARIVCVQCASQLEFVRQERNAETGPGADPGSGEGGGGGDTLGEVATSTLKVRRAQTSWYQHVRVCVCVCVYRGNLPGVRRGGCHHSLDLPLSAKYVALRLRYAGVLRPAFRPWRNRTSRVVLCFMYSVLYYLKFDFVSSVRQVYISVQNALHFAVTCRHFKIATSSPSSIRFSNEVYFCFPLRLNVSEASVSTSGERRGV